MRMAKTEKKIGNYTVASCIGKGRYGVCFLARDPEGRQIVLKRFRPRMFRKNKNANHYEAVILSGLKHPAIPELLGVVNNRQGYYYVLEYMEGLTLKQWLFEKKKVFTAEEIYRIGLQIFDVLEYLHSRNVVHGDISVANVTDDGEKTALLDFGLARYADGKNIRFSLDYARAANVLLYLLYSRYEGKGRLPWYEELPLAKEQKEFLKELLDPEKVFGNPCEVKQRFRRCFAVQQH